MADVAALEQALIKSMPKTMGPCLVGSYLSSVFYGVTLLQTYQYYTRYYGQDKAYLPILVAVLTVLDTFAVISNMNSLWFYLIGNYAKPLAILSIDWSLTFSVVATAIVAFLVQGFYAYRVYILANRRPWVPAIILIFAFASMFLAIYYMALLFKNGSLFYIPTVTFLSTSSLACSLAADTLIATSITALLLKGRTQGLRQTDKIIQKLVIYTINTGVLTTVCTAVTLALGEAVADTFYNTMFYFPLSKCYVNSMLAFLNTRESLRGDGEIISYQLGTKLGSSGAATQSGTIRQPPAKTLFDISSLHPGDDIERAGKLTSRRMSHEFAATMGSVQAET